MDHEVYIALISFQDSLAELTDRIKKCEDKLGLKWKEEKGQE